MEHYLNNQSLPHDAQIYHKKLTVFLLFFPNPSAIIRGRIHILFYCLYCYGLNVYIVTSRVKAPKGASQN